MLGLKYKEGKHKFVPTTWIKLLTRMLFFSLLFDCLLDIRLYAILQMELKVSLLWLKA